MPPLVRLYIRQVAIGFALAAVLVAGILWFNVANLRYLVLNAQGGYLALFLLWVFNGIVLAAVQFAIAIMGMAEDRDDDDDDDRGMMIGHAPVPVPVRSAPRC